VSVWSGRISGVMAVRDLDGVVGQTLDSVLAQTRTDWELVVVDDASTDRTAEVVADYAAADPRIRLIRQGTRLGRARARNLAAAHARGEFLAVVDGDDVSEPDRFAALAGQLEADPGCAVVSGQVVHLFDDGSLRHLIDYPTDAAGIAARFGHGAMAVSHAACMIRKDVFDRYGGYHGDCLRAQDLELFLRMFPEQRFANLSQTVLRYRNTPSTGGLAFWLELHRYHEYARYRSARTAAADNPPQVLPFARWRHRPWCTRRVYTWHLARYLKHRLAY
jgi:glycosyltransferase involved in cell wall biosynthesis